HSTTTPSWHELCASLSVSLRKPPLNSLILLLCRFVGFSDFGGGLFYVIGTNFIPAAAALRCRPTSSRSRRLFSYWMCCTAREESSSTRPRSRHSVRNRK